MIIGSTQDSCDLLGIDAASYRSWFCLIDRSSLVCQHSSRLQAPVIVVLVAVTTHGYSEINFIVCVSDDHILYITNDETSHMVTYCERKIIATV